MIETGTEKDCIHVLYKTKYACRDRDREKDRDRDRAPIDCI